MKDLIVFLNELSLEPGVERERHEVLQSVQALFDAVRDVRKIRADCSVVSGVKISSLTFCSAQYSLAELLKDNRDQWRFIKGLAQRSPWDSHDLAVKPEGTADISFEDKSAIGMLWAFRNDSFILSFALDSVWEASKVAANLLEIGTGGEVESEVVEIRNIAERRHVDSHRQSIVIFGNTESSSSIVFEGEGFVIRMYFNDHGDPHFHVMARRDTSDTLAKYRVDTLDLMEGRLPPNIRRRVVEWARRRNESLLSNWELCRRGQKPLLILNPAVGERRSAWK